MKFDMYSQTYMLYTKIRYLMTAENNHVWRKQLHLVIVTNYFRVMLNMLEAAKKAHMRNNTPVYFLSHLTFASLFYILVNITLKARISTLHKTEYSWLLLGLLSLSRTFTCTFWVLALPSTNYFDVERWGQSKRAFTSYYQSNGNQINWIINDLQRFGIHCVYFRCSSQCSTDQTFHFWVQC